MYVCRYVSMYASCGTATLTATHFACGKVLRQAQAERHLPCLGQLNSRLIPSAVSRCVDHCVCECVFECVCVSVT